MYRELKFLNLEGIFENLKKSEKIPNKTWGFLAFSILCKFVQIIITKVKRSSLENFIVHLIITPIVLTPKLAMYYLKCEMKHVIPLC